MCWHWDWKKIDWLVFLFMSRIGLLVNWTNLLVIVLGLRLIIRESSLFSDGRSWTSPLAFPRPLSFIPRLGLSYSGSRYFILISSYFFKNGFHPQRMKGPKKTSFALGPETSDLTGNWANSLVRTSLISQSRPSSLIPWFFLEGFDPPDRPQFHMNMDFKF